MASDGLIGRIKHCLKNALLLLHRQQPTAWPYFCLTLPSSLVLWRSLLHTDAELGAGALNLSELLIREKVSNSPWSGPCTAMLPTEHTATAIAHWRKWLLCLIQMPTRTALGREIQPKLFGVWGGWGCSPEYALLQSPPKQSPRCCWGLDRVEQGIQGMLFWLQTPKSHFRALNPLRGFNESATSSNIVGTFEFRFVKRIDLEGQQDSKVLSLVIVLFLT